MSESLITVVGGVLVAGISGAVAVMVSRLNTRGASKNATIPPYDRLADRVSRLEESDEEKGRIIDALKERLAMVIGDRDALVVYVRQLATWAAGGAKPPPPSVPLHLRDLIDPTLHD